MTERQADAIDDPGAPAPPAAAETVGPPAPGFAGFWRRVAATLVDGVVLFCVASLVGLAFGATLSTMGGLERIIGFLIALAYAGLLNSHLGGGRTLGKRLLGIRVLALDGALLSVPRALLRQVVFAVPVFLNGAPLPDHVLLSFWIYPLSLLIFGGMFASLYLLVFNRPTRRSLHDLAAGSCVMRVGAAPDPGTAARIWPVHLYIIAAFALVTLMLPLVTQRLASTETFAGLLRLNQALGQQPGVATASTNIGTQYRAGATSRFVRVTLRLDHPGVGDANRARQFAGLVLAEYPAAADTDALLITQTYGYDMVIASSWRSQSFQFKPSELRQDPPTP